jgi:hypothetical protein
VQLITYHTAVVMSTDVSAVSKFVVPEPSAPRSSASSNARREINSQQAAYSQVVGHTMSPAARTLTQLMWVLDQLGGSRDRRQSHNPVIRVAAVKPHFGAVPADDNSVAVIDFVNPVGADRRF